VVLAFHVTAARRDGVAFDRLAVESRASGGPILESAGLEIEVQGMAIFVGGKNALRRRGEKR
jgi:hypothetical protein